LLNGEALASTERMALARQAIATLPEGVCVEADDRIAPQLTPRHPVLLPSRPGSCATWMILDTSQASTGWLAPSPEEALADGRDRGFKVVERFGPYVVLTTDPAQGAAPARG
jgi:hypothetical protein